MLVLSRDLVGLGNEKKKAMSDFYQEHYRVDLLFLTS